MIVRNGRLVLCAMIVTLSAGCATSPPLLNAEEETMLRRICATEDGCAIVPGALWREIERLLRALNTWREI